MSAQDIPTGEVQDNDYKSRTGQNEIPVQADDKPVEDPIDPETADSDAQLGTFCPHYHPIHKCIQPNSQTNNSLQKPTTRTPSTNPSFIIFLPELV
jgi:hypothetical protein